MTYQESAGQYPVCRQAWPNVHLFFVHTFIHSYVLKQLYAYTLVYLSIRPPVGQRRHKSWASIRVSVEGREMCSVEMAIGECSTHTDIIHPGQYPKMANYTDQLVG